MTLDENSDIDIEDTPHFKSKCHPLFILSHTFATNRVVTAWAVMTRTAKLLSRTVVLFSDWALIVRRTVRDRSSHNKAVGSYGWY